MEFVAAPKKRTCFLCAKGAEDNDHDNHVIARGRWTFLLLNTFPYNSGHLLVAPYRHVPDLEDLRAAERTELLNLVLQAKAVMTRLMRPDGFNFGFNLGAAAGAGVPAHVHGHLVPRWAGDTNFMPVLGDTRVVPQALVDTAALLRQGMKEARG
jgi:ATP adenylyltransferase